MGVSYTPLLTFGVPITMEQLRAPRALAFLELDAYADEPDGWFDGEWIDKDVNSALARRGLEVVHATDSTSDGYDLVLAVKACTHRGKSSRSGGTGSGDVFQLQTPTEAARMSLEGMAHALELDGSPAWRLGVEVA